MQLYRLIYASKFKAEVDPSELSKIHVSAARNNVKNEITGVLIFGNDTFLQYIEGSSVAINTLYRKIVNDPRHSEVTLVDYSAIPDREFQNWSMKLFMLTHENLKIAKELSNSNDYEPHKMTADMATKFIRSFKH